MLQIGTLRSCLRAAAVPPFALAVLAAGPVSPALAASQEIILHTFRHPTGQYPTATLIADSAGNLYGTTNSYGIDGSGLVFVLTKRNGGHYGETVLYRFGGYPDGLHPNGLIRSKSGSLYGTTYWGGSGSAGDVFKLAPDGHKTLLYAFTGGSDGRDPNAGVIADKAGNLYGTTIGGGAHKKGVVFKLTKSADYAETVLHSFGSSESDGVQPDAGLMLDSAGNLYGTTIVGGTGNCSAGGCGTVYKLTPEGVETVLYNLKGGSDGSYPYAGVIEDRDGNFYGTAYTGGADDKGVVFKLAPDGTETVLYSFAGGSDGSNPYAGVTADEAGNLYGTTEYGGPSDLGTVFKLASDGTETVLHSFAGGSDGSYPQAGVIVDEAGNLYGATQYGGTGKCNPLLPAGCGVVFEIENSHTAAETRP